MGILQQLIGSGLQDGRKIRTMGGNRLLAVTVGAVVLAVLVPATSEGATKPVSFPSKRTEAVSPGHRFAIVNVDSDTEPHHMLFLADRQRKTRRKLLEYARQVEVLWNPDSFTFAVTDYAGSNVADCLVFSVTDDGEPRNVADALWGTITNPKEQASLRDSSHIYWTAVRWKSPHSLLVKVWGHTDVPPARNFQYFHTYNLPSGR